MALLIKIILLFLIGCIDVNYPKSNISSLKSAVITNTYPASATEIYSDIPTITFNVTIQDLNDREKEYKWIIDDRIQHGETNNYIYLNINESMVGLHTIEFVIIDHLTQKEVDYYKWHLVVKKRKIASYINSNNQNLIYALSETPINLWDSFPVMNITTDGSNYIETLLNDGFKVSFFADDQLIYTTNTINAPTSLSLESLIPSFYFETANYFTMRQISAKFLYQGEYLDYLVLWKIIVKNIDAPLLVTAGTNSPALGDVPSNINQTVRFDIAIPSSLDKRMIQISYLFNGLPIANCPSYFASEKTYCSLKITGPGTVTATINNLSPTSNAIDTATAIWNIIIY